MIVDCIPKLSACFFRRFRLAPISFPVELYPTQSTHHACRLHSFEITNTYYDYAIVFSYVIPKQSQNLSLLNMTTSVSQANFLELELGFIKPSYTVSG